ncbi:MAG: hypothetical protein KO463_01680 [Candidatus Methanofastidiosa archaeon]|nr:hypothetical protein [Candidatus Methanofastidiosa archaeon]
MVSSPSDETLVILDTNFLISAVKFGISLDAIADAVPFRHRVVVPENVRGELAVLSFSGADERARRLACSLACLFDSLELSGPVDASLVAYAEGARAIVATNDRALRRILRSRRVPVLYIRNRSHFVLDGAYQNI